MEVTVLVQLLFFHLDFQADSLQYTECIYVIHTYMYTTLTQQVFTSQGLWQVALETTASEVCKRPLYWTGL